MFNKLFDDKGYINIIQLIKLSSLIVFIVVILTKLFSKSSSLEFISYKDYLVIVVLLFIQVIIFAYVSIQNFIDSLRKFVIKDLQKYFISFRVKLKRIINIIKKEELLPENINLIKLSIIRC